MYRLARKYRITSPADKLAQALKLETDKLDSLWHARSTEDDRDAQVKVSSRRRRDPCPHRSGHHHSTVLLNRL